MRVKVIGLGGIGSNLLPILLRYFRYQYIVEDTCHITLVDGDRFENSNRNRQNFPEFGNKAEVLAAHYRQQFSPLRITGVPAFIHQGNIYELVGEDDVVLLGVDNHATRKLVSNHCEELENVVLISGGNELTDGNVQVYVRKNGCDLTLPLDSVYHPEIAEPKDHNPHDVGCAELAAGSPQIVFTNNAIAAAMLNVLYTWQQGKLKFDELYLDIINGNVRAVSRSRTKNLEPKA